MINLVDFFVGGFFSVEVTSSKENREVWRLLHLVKSAQCLSANGDCLRWRISYQSILARYDQLHVLLYKNLLFLLVVTPISEK